MPPALSPKGSAGARLERGEGGHFEVAMLFLKDFLFAASLMAIQLQLTLGYMPKLPYVRATLAAAAISMVGLTAAFAANPPTPTITAIYPNGGGAGTWVTIQGTNLGSFPLQGSAAATATTTVTFNGTPATVIVGWGTAQNQPAFAPTPTQITVVAPGGATPGALKLTVNQNDHSGSSSATYSNFAYAGGQILLSNLMCSPSPGKPGQPVKITGTITLQGVNVTLTHVYLANVDAGDGSASSLPEYTVDLPTNLNINSIVTLNPGLYELIVTASNAPTLTKGFPFIVVQ
jgi:hypothetical protein